MEEFAVFLSRFHQDFKSEILEFYKKFYNYTLELLEERDFDFSTDIFNDKDKSIGEIIEKVVEITNLAFMTIGVPKTRLTTALKQIKEIYMKNSKKDPNYYKNYQKDLKGYIEKILLEILLEYLINMDIVKIKNLDLFDLLPINFINKVDKFKQEHGIPAQINTVRKEDISEIAKYINPSNFSIDIENIRADKRIIFKPTSHLLVEPLKINNTIKKESPIQEGDSLKLKPSSQKIESPRPKPKIQERLKSFIDEFGKLSPIKEEILKKFNINKENLINTKIFNSEFFDLQNLFYIISILKLLNVKIPFKADEVIYALKNYVNGKIFSSSIDGKPDPISNYYGLSILSELHLLNDTEIINVHDIQMYLESELKNFIPEKLHLNFYTILCLKVLEQSAGLMALKTHLITPILSLDILSSKESYSQILDIFEHLAMIKILDETQNLNQFKFYTKKLKKLINQNGKFYQNITDSARVLLIFDLLDLKKTEFNICKKLFNFITNSTVYFDTDNLNKYFNWKIDKIAFTIELRMLFWALIACAQYSKLI